MKEKFVVLVLTEYLNGVNALIDDGYENPGALATKMALELVIDLMNFSIERS